ncbi:thiamine pyrophosphate-binding protein [Streptomyces buecherae]|uniref:Thiamine pyrophosphate-binding protein n=1 Tax=Streptomyces buecherae TaxID=2763006 RepID=A0A7H8NGM2_9ACTN|nr:thiamine pyrophosphate-binding protein [Streptomyces buecherae]QKW53632.1 thiamine pyrophosphate-binding protein [Streptomyces buecherae]
MKARESLADALADWGIETVFALLGATNQDLLCDLSDRLGIRLVHARHESSAVSMADGYARFTGRPGCAAVTAGPGLTNTVTALAVARSHRTPLLLLAGDTATGDTRNPQHLDQEALARLVECPGGTLRSADDLPDLLTTAAAALADHLPLVLNLPVDIQSTPTRAQPAPTLPTPPRHGVDPEQIEAAAKALGAARRPLVLAGRGAVTSGAGPTLRRLAEHLHATLATTLRANGLFAGHHLDAGTCGAMGDGRADHALSRCDALLAAGTSLHPLSIGALADAARVIRIDHIQHATPHTSPATVFLHGDTHHTAHALHTRLTAQTPRQITRHHPTAPRDHSAPDSRPYQDTDTTLDPRHALHRLLPLLAPDSGIVIGGGHAAITACQLLPATAPRHWTCASVDFGAIGQSLAVAIGACFARPDQRTIHVTGDGDLMMALAELDTAVRYDLPLTVIVLNDQGFGQERHHLGRATHANHPSPDFADLARTLGANGYRLDGPADLHRLSQALSHQSGVVVIDIRTNPAYRNPASPRIARALTAPSRA